MRNVVVDEYLGINQQIFWDTIQTDLPSLVGWLEGLLNRTRGVACPEAKGDTLDYARRVERCPST